MKLQYGVVAASRLAPQVHVVVDRQLGMTIEPRGSREADDAFDARQRASEFDLPIDELAAQPESVDGRRRTDCDELVDFAVRIVRMAKRAVVGEAGMGDRSGA